MREHRIEYVVQRRTPGYDWEQCGVYDYALDAMNAVKQAQVLRWEREYRIVMREITETVL